MNALYRMRRFSNGKLVGQAYFVSLEAAEHFVANRPVNAEFTYEVTTVQPKELVHVNADFAAYVANPNGPDPRD